MKGRAASGGLALLAAALLALPSSAGASPAPPENLQVEGGEESWHPQRHFRLFWRIPASEDTIAAVHYLVRNPDGSVAIGPIRIGSPETNIEVLEAPHLPGAYTAEVRLEDMSGEVGAPATAKLRFDDVRPGDIEPLPPEAWIGRTAFPLSLRLSHPEGEPPVSGILGYAVSVATVPDRSPCAAGDRCSDAEMDLRGGPGDDLYSIAELPEGTNYVQALAVSGSGMSSLSAGRGVLRVDKTSPKTTLQGQPRGWTNRAVSLTATAVDGASGMAPGPGPSPFTAIAIDGGAPAIASGASVSAAVIEDGVHTVAYYARDLAGNVDDGGATNGIANPASATAVVRIDRRPPSVAFRNSVDPIRPELIRVRVVDSLAGPDPVRGGIGVRRANSEDRFVPLPPAPTPAGELRARWDSDAFAPGEYEFGAIGYDAAGNAARSTRRANGTAMVLSNPLKAATVVRASLGRRPMAAEAAGRGAERTITYGRGATVSGLLTSRLGTGLGRMPVRIVERFAAPVVPSVRVSTVTTDANGAFSAHLAPGPSREVTAVFDGTPALTRSSSRPLRLGVRSAVSLRVSSSQARVGGAPIVFRGQVAAAPGTIPASGKSVQLQFRLPGLPWGEFRTIQTDRRGRFRYAYRFSDDDSRGARFHFRAYAPAQANWPYEPAGSRPITVRGI